MADMDGWCPSCGYSVDPGTQFCGGCGQQLAASPGAPAAPSPAMTMQSRPASFGGYGAPAGSPPAPLPAPVPSQTAPPPPSGRPLSWPPPPAPGPAGPGEPKFSDTVDRMLRPQGLFNSPPPAPAEWQTPYPPAPGPYPPGGQYPQSGPYPQSGQHTQSVPYPPPPGQYAQPGGPQAGPPVWPAPPTGAVPSTASVPPGYPGGGPQSGGYPGPYAGGGQYPGTQFGPDDTLADGAPGGPEGPGGRFPFRRPKGPLLPVAVAVLVAVIVVAAIALSSHGGSSANTPSASTSAGATPSASTSGTSSLTQQQAATALSGLLSQSGTDHADVNTAFTRVETCKGLAGDARTFSQASANRQALLAKLAQLPGRSALPAAMLSNLNGAWQASATVDADLAKWATDEAGGCKKNDFKDPNYTATAPFDSKATNDKTEFVGKWNSLAKKYGLRPYQPSQI